MDSYSFFQKIILMFEGLKQGDLITHFSYGYYNTDIYTLLLLLLSIPFIIFKQFSAVIVYKVVSLLYDISLF